MSTVAKSVPIHFRCPVPALKKVIVVKYDYYYYTTPPRITITSSTTTTATIDFIDCMSGSGAGTGVDVNCRRVIANSF